MKSLREKIEIMQAYLDGKSIEYASEGMPYIGCTGEPAFDWESNDYRIKPEPIVIWVNIYDKGDFYLHKSKSKAVKAVTEFSGCKRRAVKFVEARE